MSKLKLLTFKQYIYLELNTLQSGCLNIQGFRQRQSWLIAPSTVTPVKSLINEHALCSWSQKPSRQYQQCSMIFAIKRNRECLDWSYIEVTRHWKNWRTWSSILFNVWIKQLLLLKYDMQRIVNSTWKSAPIEYLNMSNN